MHVLLITRRQPTQCLNETVGDFDLRYAVMSSAFFVVVGKIWFRSSMTRRPVYRPIVRRPIVLIYIIHIYYIIE